MITTQLLRPESIVVVGASNNVHKPGGAILKNLINGGYQGELRAVNPKEKEVQGVPAFADVKDLPDTDLAVLAVPAGLCPDIVETLASTKQTRAFIILSAGFGEETHEGALLEERILETVNKYGASLIGPNCIGLMNTWHHSVFSQPIPNLNLKGVDLISSSGATAVFILESAVTKGLQFNSVWSVGNAKQIGVEDVLQFMDENFDPEKDSHLKLLYIESIQNPDRLLFHASSLIRKGCKIAAIKAGSSESGSRAASSHTGAIASSDSAVEALFRKAGIVRCFSREELTTVGCVFTLPELKGKNFAIITHAGGPGVMLTDALSKGGLNVPKLEGELAEELKTQLFPGAAVGNPIDILATGTPEHLRLCIDYCEEKLENARATKMVHIAEFTADLIHHNKLNLRPERNTGIITTFHDSCNPARAMGMLEEPRAVLRAVCPEFVEMPPHTIREETFCCGSGSGLNTEEIMELRLRAGFPRGNALRYVQEKNGVNWMSCVCAIDRATLPPLANYWAPGVTVSGLHELVANALVMKGEQPRTMNLRQEDLECPDPEPEEEAVEELAASAEEDN